MTELLFGVYSTKGKERCSERGGVFWEVETASVLG